jgi:uncharacterized membrane protein
MAITRAQPAARLRVPGLLLGIGFGGFVDGIVLHQILQWHHMLSSTPRFPPTTLEGLEANTVADGLFHLATWLVLFAGVGALWAVLRRGPVRPPSWRLLVGSLLAGWGIFNLVEGVIDHHLLGVHHVRTGPDQLAWDLGFLVLGAVLLAAGTLLARTPAAQRDG